MPRWSWVLAAAGAVAAVAASALDPASAGGAAAQVWPAFVLVAGLLLIGLVAADDLLFAAAGRYLASSCPSGRLLFAGVAGLVLVVTAVLNLDTSVAFLTPVVVHTAKRRRGEAAVLVPACLLLSNAGSLLLPGSNLTNLIVLGHMHMPGGRFASRMGLPWIAAGVLTAAVVAFQARRELRRRVEVEAEGDRPVLGLGLLAVAAAVAVIVTVGAPALPVVAVGVAAVVLRLARRRLSLARVLGVLDLPVLAGLFGLAVGLGALGRDWSFPARTLEHLDPWATAAAGAIAAVVINNLPAASLLSARPPAHPLSLLVGLDIGPNLFVSGSLAWVLWYNAARAAGAQPDVWRTVRMGLVAAPLAGAAAVGILLLTGQLT